MQFPEKPNNCSIITPCPSNRQDYVLCALVKVFIGIMFFLSSLTLLAHNTVTDSLLHELQKAKEACPDCAGDTTVVKILNK
ncbi:MAG: hypothetical protein IIA88_01440, partial [Bacteroidetes bacterium]|nr:hypothetical protein [Bacteroidota bacterium]